MDNNMFSGEWIFAFLIIAVMFGWGGNGVGHGAPAPATAQDIAIATNAQTSAANQQAILLSSANNNYETSRLVTQQTEALMNQNNSNLINAIQGFNQIGQSIMNQTNVLGSKLDALGYQMENCCCSIKTLIKDNQIADLTNQLNNANNIAVNSAQSQYLLGQMGKWVANAPSATT